MRIEINTKVFNTANGFYDCEVKICSLKPTPSRVSSLVNGPRALEIVKELMEGECTGLVFCLPEEFTIVGRLEYE